MFKRLNGATTAVENAARVMEEEAAAARRELTAGVATMADLRTDAADTLAQIQRTAAAWELAAYAVALAAVGALVITALGVFDD
jgi:hypothetical protein